jgi:hypothetical protein
VAVNRERLADVADLVAERNLERMKAIARVLDHYGGTNAHDKNGSVNILIKTTHEHRLFFLRADQNKRPRVEILERCPFAKKFRVNSDAEIAPSLLSRAGFERGHNEVLHRPRQDRASDNDRVPLALRLHAGAYLSEDALDMRKLRLSFG